MAEHPKRRVAVVLDADRRHVLLARFRDGWALPSWEAEPEASWPDVGPVDEALRSRFGLDGVVLRPLRAVTPAPTT